MDKGNRKLASQQMILIGDSQRSKNLKLGLTVLALIFSLATLVMGGILLDEWNNQKDRFMPGLDSAESPAVVAGAVVLILSIGGLGYLSHQNAHLIEF